MVKETRITFGLGDVQAIRFTCTNCGREIGHSLSAERHDLPNQCPWCRQVWSQNDNEVQSANLLLEMLYKLPHQENKKIEIILEIDGSES